MNEQTERQTSAPTPADSAPAAGKRRRPLWLRALKWTGITAGVLVALFLIVCTLIVWILTPGKLTPIVERQASEYLDADIRIGRVELTFWHTFPKMTVDVDSLEVISRSLRKLSDAERATLPADADSLLRLTAFHGGLNILPLMTGNIHLYDVIFREPTVNLVAVNDSVANYDIVPPSEEAADSSSLFIPGIILNRFVIENSGPLRYRSLADSTDLAVSLENVTLHGPDAPVYRLSARGATAIPLLKDFNLHEFTFGIDGRLEWSPDAPLCVAARDVKLDIDRYAFRFDTALDLSDAPTLTELRARVEDFPVADALTHLPADLRTYAAPLKTDMKVSSSLELTRPWVLTDTAILPSFRASLSIPSCKADYQQLHLREAALDLEVDFDGEKIDNSRFNLKKLRLAGRSIDVSLSGKASAILSDPKVEGRFRGNVALGTLPASLTSRLPVRLVGRISGESDFRFRLSDLAPKRFHRVYADGSIEFTGLEASAPDGFLLRLNNGRIEFGTTDSFVREGHKVDSLLKVSLKIDTLSALADSMVLELKNLRAGIGSVNRKSSSDTSEINPFGGSIALERLKFDSAADTLRIRLRDARIGGALRRFEGNARAPLMNLRINAARMMMRQAFTRFSLRETDMALNINLRPRKEGRPDLSQEERTRRRHAADSIDSVSRDNGDVDLRLGRGMRRMLRRWDYNGSLRATRGRFVTPVFPLDNRLSRIDLRFNADSVILSGLKYTAGESDFLIDGTISNIRRALTSRRNNTLGIRFNVTSDTINVNQIVKALFAGTAPRSAEIPDSQDQDDDLPAVTPSLENDTAATGPLLLPHNLDAHIRVRARNILYSDLELHGFRGDLLLYDGALNLRDLSASTDIGSISLNGLYSATHADSLQFGLGMKVNRFMLDRLTSLVPAIDTMMPMMRDFAGIVNADIAVTTALEKNMDINIPSMRAAIKIEGDSLVLLDADTFKTLSKWLMFKNKKHNMIDHLSVEVVIDSSTIELYPFMFDIDRYRLGVMGHNDLAMNLNYHISVLKSPMPFKFGINIKGTPENMKIRLGGAKFKENMIGERQIIADNTRINLVREIDNVFRRGVSKARSGRLSFRPAALTPEEAARRKELLESPLDGEERMSYADSLRMIRAGLIENPDTLRFPPAPATGR